MSSAAYANTWPEPQQFQGSTTRQSFGGQRGDLGERARIAELGVVGGYHDGSAPSTPCSKDAVGVGTWGSWTATSASSRSSRRTSLWASESRSSSVSALKARPSTAILRSASAPEAPLDPLDQEQRHRLVHARDREQHPGRVGALLGEGEVLAQARPRGQAGQGDPAAGVVAVDQVDHVEHVRRVALAIHHQKVRQREVRVAQDVRPDLRELGLYGRRLHDRRLEGREQLRGNLSGARADAADDAGQRVDLLAGSAPRRSARARARRTRPRRSESRGAWPDSRPRTRSSPARPSSAGSARARARAPRAGRRARSGCRACRSRCARTRACRA